VSIDPMSWFVNREKQFLGFQKLLAGETPKRVMLVQAPADMGKTWLIQRMQTHCLQNGIPAMQVSFADRQAYDYLALVRLGRDQLGPESFNSLTQTINSFTQTSITLSTGQGSAGVTISEVDTSSVAVGGDVAGRDIIRDNQFFINADSEITRRAAEIQINDAFFLCLQEFPLDKPVVFLFDACENIGAEAKQWIVEQLLLRIGEGLLKRVIVIIAGRTVPEINGPVKPLIAQTGLDSFTEDHVREYIVDRRHLQGLDLATLFRASGGFPGLLAKMADIASMSDKNEDDEWL